MNREADPDFTFWRIRKEQAFFKELPEQGAACAFSIAVKIADISADYKRA